MVMVNGLVQTCAKETETATIHPDPCCNRKKVFRQGQGESSSSMSVNLSEALYGTSSIAADIYGKDSRAETIVPFLWRRAEEPFQTLFAL